MLSRSRLIYNKRYKKAKRKFEQKKVVGTITDRDEVKFLATQKIYFSGFNKRKADDLLDKEE